MTPRMWFVQEAGADLVARRNEIWALLGWYHEKIVAPQLTISGQLRRLWWRLTGQTARLYSPWEALAARVEEIKAQRQMMHELSQTNGDAPLTDHPSENGNHGPHDDGRPGPLIQPS